MENLFYLDMFQKGMIALVVTDKEALPCGQEPA